MQSKYPIALRKQFFVFYKHFQGPFGELVGNWWGTGGELVGPFGEQKSKEKEQSGITK